MHQNDALFSGYFSLPAGVVKEFRLHFDTHGKTFSFNLAVLTHFVREIQRAEYFDSILARSSIEHLEKMTMQFEDQMREIVIAVYYATEH